MRQASGFSLIELMVTLAVAAILLSVGVPSFAEFIRNNRIAAGTNNLVSAFQVARVEAIRRGEPITLCSSSDPSAASVSCAGGLAWGGKDMVLVVDAARSGSPSPDELVQVFSMADLDLSITAPDTSNGYIRFLPNGEVQTGSDLEVSFTLVPDTCHGQQRRQVYLNRMGRVRSQRLTCS